MKSRPTCIHLKTKVLQAPAIAVALALILGINTQAFGQAPGPGVGSNFEIDGNLHSESSILDDWLAGAGGGVLNSAGIPFDSTLTFHVIDLTGNSDLDVFAQSDKVFHDPNTYNWKTGSVPQKDDINNGLFHLRFAGNGDLWGIMSGDRRAVNGDSYIDFELLQNSLFKNTDGSFTSLGPDGGRTIGDILLTIEFTRGGSAASFFVQFWDSIPGTNPLEFTYFDTTVSANQAFVSANTDSSVSVPYGAFGSTLYQVNAFGEAAINISQVIPSADSCFGIATIFIRTKSSQSTTAQLKDMIEP
ncbi:MAG: hypothetical protein IIB00_10355, partial [candidate division Zixibacteria bacterium]|nr:hypothetical protein [candidate division Zixibacteria bacterium]